MREIDSSVITDVIARLCGEANTKLPGDIKRCIIKSRNNEPVNQDRKSVV